MPTLKAPQTEQLSLLPDIATLHSVVMEQEYTEDIIALIDAVPTEHHGPRAEIRDLEGYEGPRHFAKVKIEHSFRAERYRMTLRISTYSKHTYVEHKERGHMLLDWEQITQYYAAQCDTIDDLRDVQRRVAEMACHRAYGTTRRPTPAPDPMPSLPLRPYLHPASGTPRHWR